MVLGNPHQRKKTKDWRGWRFVALSSVLALALVGLLFLGRETQLHWDRWLPSAGIFQHFQIQEIQLSLHHSFPSEMPFESLLQRQAESWKGRSIWSFSPKAMAHELSLHAFVERVRVRRLFPNRLEIDILIREPRLLLRGEEAWVLADQNGQLLYVTKALSASLLLLPQVYGLESRLRGDTEQLNHSLAQERQWLSTLYSSWKSLEERLRIQIFKMQLVEAPWSSSVFVRYFWQGMSFDLPLDLEESRFRALQFILSDLKSREQLSGHLRGNFGSRWYFKEGGAM